MSRARAAGIPHSRPTLDASDQAAVVRVLESGMIAAGQEVAAFEHEVGEALSMPAGVATSSGTSALAATLRGLGVTDGDEVILPSYVCPAVLQAVRSAGAQPALCDVETDWCMSVATVGARLTSRTRAVIVVHPFGIAADGAGISRLGVPVIEDCCQAINAPGTGNAGIALVVSFHATKLLTTAEGGMALTRDPALAARIRAAAGSQRAQMSDVQAALGRSQLRRYPAFLAARRAIADEYFRAFAELDVELALEVRDRSICFRWPVRVSGDVDDIRRKFAAHGVQVRRGVDTLLHREAGLDRAAFPGAEACFATTVSIPIYPSLSGSERDRVLAAARAVFSTATVS